MYGGPVSDSPKVLHKLVVVLIAVVTELNRSNIAMGYPG
jgi:hypothetical protein